MKPVIVTATLHKDCFIWIVNIQVIPNAVVNQFIAYFPVLHGSAPRLRPLVPVADQPGRRTLRSGGTNRLMVPSVRRSTVGDRAFTVAGPRVWNALPEEITTSQTLSTFRQQLAGSSEDHIRTLSSEPAFLIQTINLEVALLLIGNS